MDGGETGVIVNQGNHLETGHYWDIQHCTGPEHDSQQITSLPAGGLAKMERKSIIPVLGGLPPLPVGQPKLPLRGGALPVYPPPPHCNTRGLTSIGNYLLDKMIQQHFIVELDHGGFVTPIAGASPASFIAQWRTSRTVRNKRFLSGTGFGYGADMNGLAEQSQPAGTGGGSPISYPFTSFDGGVTFGREVWGQRSFDLNKDGVANYGMYPDWLQELRLMAGPALMSNMFNGAEAYLEMWERAYGVPVTSCRSAQDSFAAGGTGTMRLGTSAESLLYSLGQPGSRPGRSCRYCVNGSSSASVSAVYTPGGTAGLLTSTAPGYAAGGVHPGSPARALSGRATSLTSGIWLGRRMRGGSRLVYGVSGGRVRYVGVAARSELVGRGTLRNDLHAAGVS